MGKVQVIINKSIEKIRIEGVKKRKRIIITIIVVKILAMAQLIRPNCRVMRPLRARDKPVQ